MKKLLLPIFVLVFTACSSDSNTTNKIPENIDSTLIAKGELYGNGDENISQQNMVITNQTDWTNLKNQMDSVNTISPGFTEQNIDFDVYELLVVFDQIRATGGFSIEIATVNEDENNIIANIEMTSPGEVATMVITQPFHIVKILKSDKTVIFQ